MVCRRQTVLRLVSGMRTEGLCMSPFWGPKRFSVWPSTCRSASVLSLRFKQACGHCGRPCVCSHPVEHRDQVSVMQALRVTPRSGEMTGCLTGAPSQSSASSPGCLWADGARHVCVGAVSMLSTAVTHAWLGRTARKDAAPGSAEAVGKSRQARLPGWRLSSGTGLRRVGKCVGKT